MRKLSKLEIREIKKKYLQLPKQKTYCKKCEQYGGDIKFKVDGETFVLSYKLKTNRCLYKLCRIQNEIQ